MIAEKKSPRFHSIKKGVRPRLQNSTLKKGEDKKKASEPRKKPSYFPFY